MQRSKYICIDDNIEKEAVLKDFKSGHKHQEPVKLRFCPDDEVSKKRQKFFVQKCQFYAKMNQLRSKGQRLEVINKLKDFIDQNRDTLCNRNTEKQLKKHYGPNRSKKIDDLMALKTDFGRKYVI